MFLPQEECVFWKNKESNTFKGWRKFSSIYWGQWNIHHRKTQTPYRIKDQRSYTRRRSKSQASGGIKQATVWTHPLVISLPNLAGVIVGRTTKQNILSQKMWLKSDSF
jgi:hypothetical protein